VANASITCEQQALNGIDASGTPSNLIAFGALHTGAGTGTTGTNEYAGVTRQSTTWNAATSAQPSHKTSSNSQTWTTDGLTAVTYVGGWSAASAGTFGIGLQLSSSVTAVTITAASGALDLSAS
jgi:hypothetical protein